MSVPVRGIPSYRIHASDTHYLMVCDCGHETELLTTHVGNVTCVCDRVWDVLSEPMSKTFTHAMRQQLFLRGGRMWETDLMWNKFPILISGGEMPCGSTT